MKRTIRASWISTKPRFAVPGVRTIIGKINPIQVVLALLEPQAAVRVLRHGAGMLAIV